ncbi:hypothetical protein IWX48DRAFT_681274, partial [Phyllosticta citricarpa]
FSSSYKSTTSQAASETKFAHSTEDLDSSSQPSKPAIPEGFPTMTFFRRTSSVADSKLDSSTKHYPSKEQLQYWSIHSNHHTRGISGSLLGSRYLPPTRSICSTYSDEEFITQRPYCSPGTPLPFSTYNFIAPRAKTAAQSPSSTKTPSDMDGPLVAATEAEQSVSASSAHNTSLASRRDGQPLPKPGQPKPAPNPKPQNPSQNDDPFLCVVCSLVPVEEVQANEPQHQEHEKRQEQPASISDDGARDSEWDRASFPDSDSDFGAKSRCSMVCSCYSCYSGYTGCTDSEGSVTVSETSTQALLDDEEEGEEEEEELPEEGESGHGAVQVKPHCGSGDGQANDDGIDDVHSFHSASSEGWVDVAEPLQQCYQCVRREEERALPSPSCGLTSYSRDSPPPPPPPPPSSPRRHGRSSDGKMLRKKVKSLWKRNRDGGVDRDMN